MEKDRKIIEFEGVLIEFTGYTYPMHRGYTF